VTTDVNQTVFVLLNILDRLHRVEAGPDGKLKHYSAHRIK